VIRPDFFERDSVIVAKDLLGNFLVRKTQGETLRYKIIETEAYGDSKDLASHARHGQTARTKIMWDHPGTIYVYFTYGMHYMLNIVTGKKGIAGAVLIRGIEGCVGPGRLTKKLFIDKKLNGRLLGKKSGLWIEKGDDKRFKILTTPRIGIDYSGEWAKKLHRFVLQ